MTLPRVSKPLFEMLIPSQNKKVMFRPFVVREEKILLIAQQSGQEKDIILAIKQVLSNCAPEGFDIDSLATFDLEYMFLKLRARSINNIIEVSYRDLEDNKVYDFTVDLDEVVMHQENPVSNRIEIDDEIGIIMKYPSVNILDNAPEEITAAGLVEYLVRSCIDQIYDGDNVHFAKDCTDEEINEFIDSLDVDSFNKIREFFDNLPSMRYEFKYTNSLGNERKIELTTLSDFFIWG